MKRRKIYEYSYVIVSSRFNHVGGHLNKQYTHPNTSCKSYQFIPQFVITIANVMLRHLFVNIVCIIDFNFKHSFCFQIKIFFVFF